MPPFFVGQTIIAGAGWPQQRWQLFDKTSVALLFDCHLNCRSRCEFEAKDNHHDDEAPSLSPLSSWLVDEEVAPATRDRPWSQETEFLLLIASDGGKEIADTYLAVIVALLAV